MLIGLPERLRRMGTTGNVIASMAAASSMEPVLDDIPPDAVSGMEAREWFAAFTMPQSERSVVRHLNASAIESFLPTFDVIHVWKNRQKKKIAEPLFPSYVFVHVARSERRLVFRAPGILRIIGGAQGPIPIPHREIEILQAGVQANRIEPFQELAIGERVRIRCGPMEGVEGILVRKKNGLRVVITVSLISRQAALEIDGTEVEPLLN